VREGGSWTDVRRQLSDGGDKLDEYFGMIGISPQERSAIVSAALWATRWRELDKT
jgi:hypothetical protein